MPVSRITIFAGHYGSGKTNLALNYALWLKEKGYNAVICDLDIVNPYFRTADSAEILRERGVGLITSAYANTNVDLPSIPSGAKAIFDNKELYAVIDLGGDDRGALALGRYAREIEKEGNYEMLLVANMYRPLTGDADSLIEIKNEIEAAAGVRFTGIVNNSNLGGETVLQDVLDSVTFADTVSRKIMLPVKMATVSRQIAEQTGEDVPKLDMLLGAPVFPIDIYKKTIWKV